MFRLDGGSWLAVFFWCIVLCSGARAQRGLDPNAVPSFAILGVGKGGTTDMYSMVRRLHPGFPVGAEKEYDVRRCGAACTPSKLRSLLNCPAKSVMCSSCVINPRKNSNCTDTLNKLNSALSRNPYTMTALPQQYLLFRDLSRFYTSMNQKTGAKTVFYLSLRDPVSTISSLYNHWLKPTQKVDDLELVLQREFAELELPENAKLLDDISQLVSSKDPNVSRVISAFHRLCANVTKKDSYEQDLRHHYILRHIYVIPIMGYVHLFPDLKSNLLISRAEYVFEDRFLFFYEHLVPFMHPPGSSHRLSGSIVPRENASAVLSTIKNVKTSYSTKANISENMKSRLQEFFRKFPLEPYLYHLQQISHSVLVPKIENADAKWWF